MVGPFFTFRAHIPPAGQRRLTMRQIRDHLVWWEAEHGPLETTDLGR